MGQMTATLHSEWTAAGRRQNIDSCCDIIRSGWCYYAAGTDQLLLFGPICRPRGNIFGILQGKHLVWQNTANNGVLGFGSEQAVLMRHWSISQYHLRRM